MNKNEQTVSMHAYLPLEMTDFLYETWSIPPWHYLTAIDGLERYMDSRFQ